MKFFDVGILLCAVRDATSSTKDCGICVILASSCVDIAFLPSGKRPSLVHRASRDTAMRTRVRSFAHFLERTGLAMAGAASGLFVAAHVGSTISTLASQAFLLIMMIGGAVGFYLG